MIAHLTTSAHRTDELAEMPNCVRAADHSLRRLFAEYESSETGSDDQVAARGKFLNEWDVLIAWAGGMMCEKKCAERKLDEMIHRAKSEHEHSIHA